MRKFIITNLLAAIAAPMLACGWMDTHNYYLFSVYNRESFSQRVNRIADNNWQAYLGTTDSYFFFDADEIIKAAQKKNDALMVGYVKNLRKYLNCAEAARDRWEYPTKQQLAQRRQTLQTIRTYAQGKLKTRLRSQHALLFMRCNMMLGRHQENVTFWEQTASKYIETVYRDMMQNIYAGALLKTGKTDQAVGMFAAMGDAESLMTHYYKKRSYEAIRQEYMQNANSPVLPFLVQDFVNNAQETLDAENEGYNWPGKMFVRNIQAKEAAQMRQFCQQVVKEGKSESPALWQSAKAWLEYLFSDRQQALQDIRKATTLKGTPRMADNAHVLQLYICAAQTQMTDDQLAQELQWLSKKDDEEKKAYGDIEGTHYTEVLDRLTHQVLIDKYTRAGRQEVVAALLNITKNGYRNYIDTMRVDRLIALNRYIKSPATTAIDQWLKPRMESNDTLMTDLIGTKYLRLCQWEQAQEWLKQVPIAYLNSQGTAVYAAHRNYNVEPWMKRQWLPLSIVYGDEPQHLKHNYKLAFAQEMQRLESGQSMLSEQARQQRAYDLAVRYAQASFRGDCWYLTQYGKSVNDTLRANETDFTAKAVALLRQAAATTDNSFREKVLFALTWRELYATPWRESVWDEQKGDFVTQLNKQSQHYQALAALAAFEHANGSKPSQYVSRCDEFKQFKMRGAKK